MFPNFEVDKFSCWGRGRVSGQSWLKTLHLLTNCLCGLQIFGAAYKFLASLKYMKGGGRPVP